MEIVKLLNTRKIKLNSYHPLCSTRIGNIAINRFNFPPYIDASCRREPDFENPYPSISALCRQGVFAPHLRIGDVVVYITIGGNFKPHKKGHHIVAILQVEEIFETHIDAYMDYTQLELPIPSNCMVSNNLPFDFDQTAGDFLRVSEQKKFLNRSLGSRVKIGKKRIQIWDKSYQNKSKQWPCFIKTRPVYLNIHNPTQILRSDFENIFGKLPNTRTPKNITKQQLIDLGYIVGLRIEM